LNQKILVDQEFQDNFNSAMKYDALNEFNNEIFSEKFDTTIQSGQQSIQSGQNESKVDSNK